MTYIKFYLVFTLQTISYALEEKLFKNNINSFYLNHAFSKQCRKINGILKHNTINSFVKT